MSRPPLKRRAARTVAAVASHLRVTGWLHARRRRRGDFRVFILEYHGVDPAGREVEGTISQERFRRHVAWLAARFDIVTLAEAARRLGPGHRLDQDLVVLTFDDGYLDNVEGAWPVLREAGVPATIFLTTGFLDGQELWFDVARRALAAAARGDRVHAPDDMTSRLEGVLGAWPPEIDLEACMGRLKALDHDSRGSAVDALHAAVEDLGPAAQPMSWDQAREIKSHGVELGAHTVNHPILSRLDAAGQRAEIVDSRDRMAQELGEAPTSFAMPNGALGDYDSTTLELLADAGFTAACTTRRGSCSPGCDLLELRRLGVGDEDVTMLDARLAGLFDEGLRRLFKKPQT